MAVTFVANGTAAGGSAASISVSAPSGIQNDDILILVVSTYNSDAMAADNGYTELFDTSYLHVYWKRTTGTESTTSVTGATNSVAAFITAFRGCYNGGSPINGVPVSGNSSGTTIATGSYSTVTDGDMAVFCYGVRDNNTTGSPSYGNLDGDTGYNDYGHNTGSDTKVGLMRGTLSTAGSIGTVQITQSSTDAWTYYTFSLSAEAPTSAAIDIDECTYIYSSGATTNYGSATTAYVGNASTTSYARALIRASDLSAIPSGATVTSASIRCYNYGEGAGSPSDYITRAYRVLRNWGEGTVTWNTYDGSNSWSTAGCASEGNDRSATVSGSGDWSATSGWLADVTGSQLATDITQMRAGTLDNYGWILVSSGMEGTADSYQRIDSDDSTTASERPYLYVEWTTSSGTTSTAASTLTGALTAAASLSYTPPARTSTAASTLTGQASAAASLTYTPPARTSTAASTLTGALSSDASVENTQQASSTAASTLTGTLAAAASLAYTPQAITATAASSLTGTTAAAASLTYTPVPIEATAASTLTSALTSSTSFTYTPSPVTATAASTLTGALAGAANLAYGAASIELAAASALSGALSAAGALWAYGAQAASTLTGAIEASASLTYTPIPITTTASSTLTGQVSASSTIERGAGPITVGAASTLTGGLTSDSSLQMSHVFTGSSPLSGGLTAAASLESVEGTVITSDVTLSLHKYTTTMTAASTLTGALSSAASVGNETTIAAASTLNLYKLGAVTVAGAATLTGGLSAAALVQPGVLTNITVTGASTLTEGTTFTRDISARATLTNSVTSSATVTQTIPDVTVIGSSTIGSAEGGGSIISSSGTITSGQSVLTSTLTAACVVLIENRVYGGQLSSAAFIATSATPIVVRGGSVLTENTTNTATQTGGVVNVRNA